jgi:hypothetical protein
VSGGLLSRGAWSQSRDVFARLHADPAMKPGVYSDALVVRVTW